MRACKILVAGLVCFTASLALAEPLPGTPPPTCSCTATGAQPDSAMAPACGTGRVLACTCRTRQMSCVDPMINLPGVTKILVGKGSPPPPPPPPKPPQ